jgi:hypothetical protein
MISQIHEIVIVVLKAFSTKPSLLGTKLCRQEKSPFVYSRAQNSMTFICLNFLSNQRFWSSLECGFLIIESKMITFCTLLSTETKSMPVYRIECYFIPLQEHCENSEENDRIGLCLGCQWSTGILFGIIIKRPYINVFAFFFTLSLLFAFNYRLFYGSQTTYSL